MKLEHALPKITSMIVRCLDPEAVILFGSVAKDSAGPHSDVDLLVVGDFRGPRHRRGAELRGLLDRYPLRLDLHLLTRAEVAQERQRALSWMATLAEYARVLYVRSEKGKDPDTLVRRSDRELRSLSLCNFFLLPDCSALTC